MVLNPILKKQFVISGIGGLLGFGLMYFVLLDEVQNFQPDLFQSLSSIILGIGISNFLYYSSKILDRFFSFHKNVGLRFIVAILIHNFISWTIIFSCIYFYHAFNDNNSSFYSAYDQILIKLGLLVFIAILLFQIIYFALYSYLSYTTYQIASVQQKRKQIELQLSALKSQLSPHFLFNCLNAVTSLIYKDEKQAGMFVRRLAKLYLYTLDSYNTRLVKLEQELDFVKSYLFLIQTRFKDSFYCTINIPEDIYDTKVPPLALQMLIENAAKHNIMQKDKPVYVDIKKEGEYISVTNTINEKPKGVTSHKIGLKNIDSRYKLLLGKGIVITKDKQFQVKIPIVP
jgi:sensor histidine kinase YesM